MSARAGRRRLLSSSLGIVSPVYQAENLDLCWERRGVDPPFIRIDQIRRPRKCNNLPPDGRGDKKQQLSGVAATNLVANRQAAKHVSYPTAAANSQGSFSMPSALEHQPHDKRRPSTSP